jgi:hypothetical protein
MTTFPSSDEWSFAEFDAERRAYLDRDMPFDERQNGSAISLLSTVAASIP